MEWYPLNTERMLSPEWLRIPPILRAHFTSLEMYCAWRSNGGLIENAKNWTARDWDRATAVPKRLLKSLSAHGLVQWIGNDLVVVGYNIEQEERARRGRDQRVNAAKSRWSNDAARNADENTSDENRNADRNAKRVKRIKEKKETSVASATADSPDKKSPPRKPPKKPPLPYTIAQVAKTLATESAGLFNPDMPDKRLAKPVTDVIRQLGDSGATLEDIAAAGRWIANGGTGGHEVGMLWLAGIGKLGNAVAQARKTRTDQGHDADGAPALVHGDGEVCTRSYP